jgi:hypothetical protein
MTWNSNTIMFLTIILGFVGMIILEQIVARNAKFHKIK